MTAAVKPGVLVASGPWPSAPWAEALAAREPARRVWCWPERPQPDAVGYVLAWKPPAAALAGMPNLRAIFSLGAGIDHLAGLALPDVPVVRIVDADLTGRMSEWVTLQVLIHHRQHLRYAEAQAARRWEELPQPPAAEVRVGIMGLGVLGQAAAEALLRLGFDVAGWSRRRREIEGVAAFSGPGELDAFLARTDILVCLLPLTEATRGILNADLFARLARDGALPGPALVNAGRGGLQVEADLDRALRDGILAGASLDVFDEEPLPADRRLWDAPNLVITPHVAAPSDPAALTARIHDQILAFEAGRPLEDVVDRSAGY